MAIMNKVIVCSTLSTVALAQNQVDMDSHHGHGHMHANGEMHYGDHGHGHDEHEHEPMSNPSYDPEYEFDNEKFLAMDSDEFWNEALPKLDHTKLDEIISQLDPEHLQKMISSMPGMPEMDDMDHAAFDEDENDEEFFDAMEPEHHAPAPEADDLNAEL